MKQSPHTLLVSRISAFRLFRLPISAVGWYCVFFASTSCSDVTSPATRRLLVPAPVKDVQPLPQVQQILPVASSTPTPPMLLAYYPWVERILVESWINGRINVSSNKDALAVHVVNALVDYKGVWDNSTNQCDWSASVASQTLTWPGPGCLTSEPRYTSIEEVKDTILVGGLPSTGNANVYAKRGGVSGDPPDCGPGVPLPCNCPDGKPCHTVTGSQTVTLTPLAATINLITPGVAQVAPKTILLPDPNNGSTMFKVSSIPATYHGITVPAQALSWQWIPAQGDSAVTTMCAAPPTDHLSNTCSVVLFERGTMVVNARVNGIVQTDSVKVIGPQVIMTLKTGASMLPTDSAYHVTSKQYVRISVVDTAGRPVSGKTVRFWLSAMEGQAGHAHVSGSTPKPTGVIPVILNTGSNGTDSVLYTAPEASGAVYIKGTSSLAGSVQKRVMVEVPGLTSYGAGTGYQLTGATGLHPTNHYATPTHIQMLQLLASEYHKSFPNAAPLWFNDSSLPSGGIFDVDTASAKRWKTPHKTHRYGQETDLRTNSGSTFLFTSAQNLRIWMIWYMVLPKANPYQRILDHVTYPMGAPPHFHLIYCDGSTPSCR